MRLQARPRITIFDGLESPPPADVNVVIDVLRAFTVAHVAFLRGAAVIRLVRDVDDALRLKRERPELLVVGEVNGLPVPGFDAGNSPTELGACDVTGRTMVLRTTHGVACVLGARAAPEVLVTGFSNAPATAVFLRRAACRVNLVASDTQGTEDRACAEYLCAQVLGRDAPSEEETVRRIRESPRARKFLRGNHPAFPERDLDCCARSRPAEFVMRVPPGEPPTIVKELL